MGRGCPGTWPGLWVSRLGPPGGSPLDRVAWPQEGGNGCKGVGTECTRAQRRLVPSSDWRSGEAHSCQGELQRGGLPGGAWTTGTLARGRTAGGGLPGEGWATQEPCQEGALLSSLRTPHPTPASLPLNPHPAHPRRQHSCASWPPLGSSKHPQIYEPWTPSVEGWPLPLCCQVQGKRACSGL